MLQEGRVFQSWLGSCSGPDHRTAGNWKIFGSTYLASAPNPEGIVFFTAFLPLFVESANPLFPQLAILAGTFVPLATLSAAL